MRLEKPAANCPVSSRDCFCRYTLYAKHEHHTLRTPVGAASELQRELEAGKRVLMQSQEEKNELKAENQRQVEEIKGLKAQLAQTAEENQKLKGGIFDKC